MCASNALPFFAASPLTDTHSFNRRITSQKKHKKCQKSRNLSQVKAVELYDLTTDPYETQNVADSEDSDLYARTQSLLRHRLRRKMMRKPVKRERI